MVQTLKIKTKWLEPNTGQIAGVPKNPRFVKDDDFYSLVASIQEDPHLLELRPLLVYFLEKDRYVVLGGNSRLRAAQHLNMPEIPANVIPENLDAAALRRIVIKDNGTWGNHDYEALANEWGGEPLADWGLAVNPDWLLDNTVEPADTDFQPTLNQATNYRDVTDADVDKTKDRLDNEMSAGGTNTVTCMCPNCGTEFEFTGA